MDVSVRVKEKSTISSWNYNTVLNRVFYLESEHFYPTICW